MRCHEAPERVQDSEKILESAAPFGGYCATRYRAALPGERPQVDRDELAALVRAHQAEIYRYLRYLGASSPAAAEDLAQETFMAAFTSTCPPLSRDERLLAAWLRGIARNLFLNDYRKRKRSPIKINISLVEEAEAVWNRDFLREGDGFETIEALQRCLERLPENRRGALDLFYRQGRSREEVAAHLKMTEDGVKSLLRGIRKVLADCIRRNLAMPGIGAP